jgi:hypothetical protein
MMALFGIARRGTVVLGMRLLDLAIPHMVGILMIPGSPGRLF